MTHWKNPRRCETGKTYDSLEKTMAHWKLASTNIKERVSVQSPITIDMATNNIIKIEENREERSDIGA